MGIGRNWTEEEEVYLQEKWGTVSIPQIAKKLDRSVEAIKIRATRLKLGAVLMGGDYVTLHQLCMAVCGGARTSNYKLTSWVKNRGLPVHKKKVNNCSFKVVNLDEFWEWAEKNHHFIDFSKMEKNILGEEPEWVAEQRRKDFEAFSLQRKDPWTPDEDSRLIMLVKQYRYGYRELSEMMRRSEGAIQHRLKDLGVKERPLKAENVGEEARWLPEHYQILAAGIRSGEGYVSIARRIGKSEKALRGKAYMTYYTENADKIRRMMGEGEWGNGAPSPTVKQSRRFPVTKALVEQLHSVLYHRTLELKKQDYDPYFQHHMCANWDPIADVCGAGEADCDACGSFKRIRPQYCVRCGGTFYERKEDRLCANCRAARRKQAYKKYMTLNKRRM